MGEPRINKVTSGVFTLNMDGKCCWITEHIKPKDKAEYDRRVTGYFANLEHLMVDFVKRAKSNDTHGSMRKTIENIMKTEHEAEGIIKAYLKEKKVR